MGSVLSKTDILRLAGGTPPLVEDYINLEEQAQPNGLDLTLRTVTLLQNAGRITVSNADRRVSDVSQLAFDDSDMLHLAPGNYMITYNEIVHLPKNVMALGRPRSSLLRCGVNIGTAVWDAGYSGRSQSLLMVHNPQGFTVQRNARVMQLVFFEMTGETDGYHGVYQNENTR